MPNRIVDENMRIKEDWRRFFEEFPDRILVSSDQFVGIPGRTKRAPSYFKETWPAVKQLPADVLYKVGRNNAAKLYHLDK